MKRQKLFHGEPIGAYLLVSIMLLLQLIGCSGDRTEELSGDYFYRVEGPTAKDILCHSDSCKSIYANVISYNFDGNFIIAAQQPIFSAYVNMVGFELRNDLKKYPTNSIEEIEESERIADSLLKHDPYYIKIFSRSLNYWIISHKDKQLYGPFSNEEYLQKRRELGVPNSLELDEK